MDDKLRTDDKHRVVARLRGDPMCSKCGCVIIKLVSGDFKFKLRVINDGHYSRCGRQDCEMMWGG